MSDYQFKIGDKIYITKRIPSNFPGWSNAWNDKYMGAYVRELNKKPYTIVSINYYGIKLKEIPYAWPKEAFTLASEYIPPKPMTKEERIILKCKKLWNTSKYVKSNPKYAY